MGWLAPARAQADTVKIRTRPLHSLASREAAAGDRFVDLGPYYNFSLSEEIHGKPGNTIPIPAGIHLYDGIEIESRGVIQLSSKLAFMNSHLEYPREITGIAVHRHADSLCFLHSSAWASKTGTEVVRIVVHYEDGRKQTIPIRYQLEVEDWWFHPVNSMIPPNARVAWEGSNPRVEEQGISLKLYLYTWANPLPGLEISTIDLISSMNDTGYMLFGLTCL
jgi:hypothetical protein